VTSYKRGSFLYIALAVAIGTGGTLPLSQSCSSANARKPPPCAGIEDVLAGQLLARPAEHNSRRSLNNVPTASFLSPNREIRKLRRKLNQTKITFRRDAYTSSLSSIHPPSETGKYWPVPIV
jgi:hypothetical protein